MQVQINLKLDMVRYVVVVWSMIFRDRSSMVQHNTPGNIGMPVSQSKSQFSLPSAIKKILS